MENKILTELDLHFKNQDTDKILETCKKYSLFNVGRLVSIFSLDDDKSKFIDFLKTFNEKLQSDDTEVVCSEESDEKDVRKKVKLLSSFYDSKRLSEYWSKMLSEKHNIRLVYDEEPDYWVIVNFPNDKNIYYDPSRTIVLKMEPSDNYFVHNPEWINPDPEKFLSVIRKCVLEWHLDFDIDNPPIIVKDSSLDKRVSSVLSGKYFDPGHIKRIDFVKTIENEIDIDIFGSNKFNYKSYKKPLPHAVKNEGLFPYKYHFNAENCSKPGYITEKLIDAILSECLCFYWGSKDVSSYIDPSSYVFLDLDKPEESMKIMKECIENDEWTKRISSIRREKYRILNDINIFKKISDIIHKDD
jgi:hypothetical protein